MDAGSIPCGKKCPSCRLDVFWDASGQSRNDWSLDLACDRLDCLEVAIADDGESSLDDVDLETGELPCDLKLLPQVHGSTGALLTITKRCVEN